MSELRRDPIGGRWVIVNNQNPKKPSDYEHEKQEFKTSICPFCYGNEGMTPQEIAAIRDNRTGSNKPGWRVRVVPNKFPALQIEGFLDKRGEGMYDMSNGIGAHEIIIETPYHHKDIPDLTNQEVEEIISMYTQRFTDLGRDSRFKYIMLFKNSGPSAGASLEHPHTQIIALPMVPKSAKEEIVGAHRYFDYRERCLFCDMIRQEEQEKQRLILQTANFVAFCPFVSRFPFEVWVVPRRHSNHFFQISTEERAELAFLLREIIGRVKKVFGNPSYNFVIHSSPINSDGNIEGYHWHLELMPKLTRVAGFEWGTGFYIVSTPPEDAAGYLRNEKVGAS